MAVGASGLNILLQASTPQLQDLLQNLQMGAVLRGRIVDLLPDGKAVINLQGQNLLAQLPEASSNAPIQKGDVLTLQVVSAPPATAGAAPALSLRLLSNNSAAPAATTPAAGGGVLAPRLSLPPQAVLEQALTAAHLPVSSATLTVARVLALNGLPLDPATLQSVVKNAESLLGAEQSAGPGPSGGLDSPRAALSAPDREILQEALPALRLAVQSTAEAAPRLAYQHALNMVESALNDGTALPLPVPAQSGPPVSVSNGLPQPDPASNAQSPAPAATAMVPAAPSLPMAVQALLSSPSSANLVSLQAALSAALRPAEPGQTSPPQAAPLQPAASTGGLLASLPVRRESAALLLSSLPPVEPGEPLLPSTVIQAAQTLSQAFSQPQSPEAQALLNSVQAQYPGSQPAQVLQQAQTALNQVVAHFEALPSGRPLAGPQALSAELEAAELPAPQVSLSQLPRETVFEAVAWLSAHDLPPQRPLVEAAAQFLSRGQAALELAQQAARSAGELPEGVLVWRPSLQSSLQGLDDAIQNSTLKLDAPDLGQQLQQWPAVSGLSLEKTLFQSLSPAPGNPLNAGVGAAAPTLREALAQVQHELRQALRDPVAAPPSVAPRLEEAASAAGKALQSFSALPLQAQPSNAFHSVSLPLALPLNGPLSAGQLTVTWRQGHDKALNEKDPVNVAVALQTDELGEVRVLLQVWKGHVSAVLKAPDKVTADFLATGAAELKQGFADRTPFRLQSLDFGVAQADEPPVMDEAPLPQGAGLNLSA